MVYSELLDVTHAEVAVSTGQAAPVSVSLKGVSKSYREAVALKPFTLDLQAGELVSLLGPSGCGKTTTLRIIAGFVAPDTGSVVLGDKDVTDLPPNARGLGMVFQSYSLFPHMTVAENVAFGLRIRRTVRDEQRRRVNEALELVRLERFAARYPNELSGGQQQRVALARALITQPSVLLLDEPLGALDKNLRERMQVEIRELQRRLRITTILVTHDQEEAMTMSDRIVVMSEGELVQIGTPEDIYNFPCTRFVSEFLGTSNLFPATVLELSQTRAVRLKLDGSGLHVSAQVTDGVSLRKGQRVTVAVRPEKLTLCTDGEAGCIETVLSGTTFRGSHRLYDLQMPGHNVPIVMSSLTPIDATVGDTVCIGWGSNAVVLPQIGAEAGQ